VVFRIDGELGYHRQMKLTALLVIDVQESFRHRPYWSDQDVPAFLNALRSVLEGARREGLPVVQIFHVEPSGPFSMASGNVRTIDGLSFEPDVVLYKNHHSALVGTDLAPWLTKRGINQVVVSGIRTEQCCETTARHASDLGFGVDFVPDATLTFAMTHPKSGRRFEAADIKERTELVLSGRFARIMSPDEVFGRQLAGH
jgi:nicotinamidase-related amidase